VSRYFRGFLALAVLLGFVLQLLRRYNLFTPGECGPHRDCSLGLDRCACHHPTCLSPADV
jgi:hypothetical protein